MKCWRSGAQDSFDVSLAHRMRFRSRTIRTWPRHRNSPVPGRWWEHGRVRRRGRCRVLTGGTDRRASGSAGSPRHQIAADSLIARQPTIHRAGTPRADQRRHGTRSGAIFWIFPEKPPGCWRLGSSIMVPVPPARSKKERCSTPGADDPAPTIDLPRSKARRGGCSPWLGAMTASMTDRRSTLG